MKDSLYVWKYKQIGETIVSNLNEKKHSAHLLEKKDDVVPFLKKLIKEGPKVTVGGSLTLDECDVLKFLSEGNFSFVNRYNAKTDEEKRSAFLAAFESDYFFCSANAITIDGKIVQLDGNGTRVAPMIWGPKNVVIIAGMNKIVPDLSCADERIKFISPMNAKRLNAKTPCTRIGECIDCESKDRICIHKTIIETGVRHPGRFIILLVAENLGL